MNNEPAPDIAPEPKVPDTQPPVVAATPSAEASAPAPIVDSPVAPTKKRSSKLIIGGIIAAAVVLLGAGSVFGYTMWYQNPDKVVHDAIINVFKAKSYSSTGTITYKGEGFSMDIALDNQEAQGSANINVKAKVTVDTSTMQQSFEAGGEARVVDGALYVKISGIQDVVEDITEQSGGAIPAYAAAIYEKIENKWISIKPSDYQDMSEDIAKQQACVTDLLKKAHTDTAMSNEVITLYKNNQIITIEEELGTKSVNGVNSLGYQIGFNQDAATKFTKGLSETSLGKEMKKCNNSIDFDAMADDIAKETGTDSKASGKVELWVSQMGHEITEFSLQGDYDTKNTFNAVFQPTFNKDITVEAPSDATPLTTVLEDIQQAVMEYYSSGYSAQDAMMFEDDFELEPAI